MDIDSILGGLAGRMEKVVGVWPMRVLYWVLFLALLAMGLVYVGETWAYLLKKLFREATWIESAWVTGQFAVMLVLYFVALHLISKLIFKRQFENNLQQAEWAREQARASLHQAELSANEALNTLEKCRSENEIALKRVTELLVTANKAKRMMVSTLNLVDKDWRNKVPEWREDSVADAAPDSQKKRID